MGVGDGGDRLTTHQFSHTRLQAGGPDHYSGDCTEDRGPDVDHNLGPAQEVPVADTLECMEAEPMGAHPRQEPRREVDPLTVGNDSQARGPDPLELPSHLHNLY